MTFYDEEDQMPNGAGFYREEEFDEEAIWWEQLSSEMEQASQEA